MEVAACTQALARPFRQYWHGRSGSALLCFSQGPLLCFPQGPFQVATHPSHRIPSSSAS